MNKNPPNESEKLTKPKLLLVEGKTDERFSEAFIKHRNISDIQVSQYKGKDNLFKALKALPARPGYDKVSTIGITRDADDNEIRNIFEQIKNHFKIKNSLSIGQFSDTNPRIGVYFFPDCENPGTLEDLCLATINTNPEMECIENFTQCMGSIKSIKNPAKTKLYAWLSACEKPPKLLGEAAHLKYFDFGHPAFNKLTLFINNLNHEPTHY